jgi:hypothetical protein
MSTVSLMCMIQLLFKWQNSNYLLRDELVSELVIHGVTSESGVNLFRSWGLCWENKLPLDSVILGRWISSKLSVNFEVGGGVHHQTASGALLTCLRIWGFSLWNLASSYNVRSVSWVSLQKWLIRLLNVSMLGNWVSMVWPEEVFNVVLAQPHGLTWGGVQRDASSTTYIIKLKLKTRCWWSFMTFATRGSSFRFIDSDQRNVHY